MACPSARAGNPWPWRHGWYVFALLPVPDHHIHWSLHLAVRFRANLLDATAGPCRFRRNDGGSSKGIIKQDRSTRGSSNPTLSKKRSDATAPSLPLRIALDSLGGVDTRIVGEL